MQSWYIACTKPGAECYAAASLAAPGRDFTVYLPKVLKRVAHAGRVSEVERPFLPRFIFVLNDGRSSRGVRTAPGVSGIIHGCEGWPALARQDVIDAIRARETPMKCKRHDGKVEIRHYVDLDAYLARTDAESFKKGELLHVLEGPFAGFNAIFQKHERQRVIAFVGIFGQQTRATFERCQVERLQ